MSVVTLNAFFTSAIMLSVFKRSVNMLNVMAPFAIRLSELFLSVVIVSFVVLNIRSAIMLSVFKRSVIMLNVAAAIGGTKRGNLLQFSKFFLVAVRIFAESSSSLYYFFSTKEAPNLFNSGCGKCYKTFYGRNLRLFVIS